MTNTLNEHVRKLDAQKRMDQRKHRSQLGSNQRVETRPDLSARSQ